jgi:hypothetical protein
MYGVGYNDFNNLVRQNLWWLPKKIVRHIHKKRFSIFWAVSCAFAIKVYKKCQEEQNFLLLKYSLWVSKNAECHADFEFIEKVLKNAPTKSISKNVTDIYTFYAFTYVRQTCFAYNFFLCAFFNNFFNGFETSVKFCVFKYLFWFFSKENFCHIALF